VKAIAIVQLILTALLLISQLILSLLLGTGVLPRQSSSSVPTPVQTFSPVSQPGGVLPPSKAWLISLRGLKLNIVYPIYDGQNFVGRADELPVDIDLDDQEPPDRVWSSRQHAVITWNDGKMTIEDLNSANGTYVNRSRVFPGQKRLLQANDVIQVGTVQLKVLLEPPILK